LIRGTAQVSSQVHELLVQGGQSLREVDYPIRVSLLARLSERAELGGGGEHAVEDRDDSVQVGDAAADQP
jgi:hypothetical protein